jgi:hypothetical protein
LRQAVSVLDAFGILQLLIYVIGRTGLRAERVTADLTNYTRFFPETSFHFLFPHVLICQPFCFGPELAESVLLQNYITALLRETTNPLHFRFFVHYLHTPFLLG